MSQALRFLVKVPGPRLDKYLAQECPTLSRSYIQKLIEEGHVTVNDKLTKASYKLNPDDRIDVTIPPPTPSHLTPEDMPLSIAYEDEDLVVVDKPAGLTVHPGPGHPNHTLANAILAHCPQLRGISGSMRPGIVHRLDKDTSGLIVVAKNDKAHRYLSRQIKERSIMKRYLALVKGHLHPKEGSIEGPIGRDPRNRKRMAITAKGREALTHYLVLQYWDQCTLVEVSPHTGRTHQIRVHLSSLGHPVMGDPTYGGKSPLLTRQFLHAHILGFKLPRTGEYKEFTSELPQDLRDVLALLSTSP